MYMHTIFYSHIYIYTICIPYYIHIYTILWEFCDRPLPGLWPNPAWRSAPFGKRSPRARCDRAPWRRPFGKALVERVFKGESDDKLWINHELTMNKLMTHLANEPSPRVRPQKTCYPSCPKTMSKWCFFNDLFGGHLLSAMSLQELFRKTLHLGMCLPWEAPAFYHVTARSAKAHDLPCQTLAFLKEVEAHDLQPVLNQCFQGMPTSHRKKGNRAQRIALPVWSTGT